MTWEEQDLINKIVSFYGYLFAYRSAIQELRSANAQESVAYEFFDNAVKTLSEVLETYEQPVWFKDILDAHPEPTYDAALKNQQEAEAFGNATAEIIEMKMKEEEPGPEEED